MSMLPRRNFLSKLGAGLASAMAAPHLEETTAESLELLPERPSEPVERLAEDETYWRRVRRMFELPRGIINLDNGNISPSPRSANQAVARAILDAQSFPVKRFEELGNSHAPVVAAGLARLLGVSSEQLALVRNATEALDIVLLGYSVRRGDEIVCSAHDYYAMRDAIDQRRQRDGVEVRVVRPAVPLPSMDALVEAYEREMSPRTRLVLVTHPSNLTGQLAPVRQITDAAHRVGACVVVDGAQSLGLLPSTMEELGCDFFGASLHKWLMAPVGWGVLWMRPEHMEQTWPLVPPPASQQAMRRFMRFGTFPAPGLAGVAEALAFHERIGTTQKGARLRYLTNYWRKRAETLRDSRFYTMSFPEMSCGMATLELAGSDPQRLEDHLWERDRILVQGMRGGLRAPEVNGIRVTPSIATTPAELDRLIDALARIVMRGPL
jgi:selenocysteine lyase/cysteine desulfurase